MKQFKKILSNESLQLDQLGRTIIEDGRLLIAINGAGLANKYPKEGPILVCNYDCPRENPPCVNLNCPCGVSDEESTFESISK